VGFAYFFGRFEKHDFEFILLLAYRLYEMSLLPGDLLFGRFPFCLTLLDPIFLLLPHEDSLHLPLIQSRTPHYPKNIRILLHSHQQRIVHNPLPQQKLRVNLTPFHNLPPILLTQSEMQWVVISAFCLFVRILRHRIVIFK